MTEDEDFSGCVRFSEEFASYKIYFFISALGRKNYGDQALERGGPLKIDSRSISSYDFILIILIITFNMDGEPGFSEIPQEIYLKYSDLFRRLIDREDCLLQVMFNDKRDVNILFVNDGRAIFMEDAVYLAFFSSFVDGHENGNCMEIDPDIAFFCFWIKNTGKLDSADFGRR